MTSKQRAERRVVRAAMRWFKRRGFFYDDMGKVEFPDDAKKLETACDALSQSRKVKGKR